MSSCNYLRALAMADDRKLFSISMLVHLLFAFLLLLDHASAQQNITHRIYALCNTANFTSNSPFARNLNNVLSFLSQNSSSSLFHSASSISNTSLISNASDIQSDNAYAIYQCRGDLSLPNCSACVSSLLSSRPCRFALGTRVQLLGCFLRYEYFDFFGIGETTFVKQNCTNSSTSTNLSFQTNLASVLNASATAAPFHGGFNASSRVSTGGESAYALAQCLGYLNQNQCATCLAQFSSYSTLCPNAVAGQVYFVTCYYLYSNTPVLLSSTGSTGVSTSPPSNPAISPAPPPSGQISAAEGTKGGSKIPVVVGTVVSVVLLGALVALFLFWRRKQQRRRTAHDLVGQERKFERQAMRFSLDELRQATENFHSENKLGEGGFGPVYKGRLKNNKEVAIKMLSVTSHQGKQEFLNEANIITNVQHRNLIELLGCCVEDSDRLLVYEYLPNRSLDLHLFDDVTEKEAVLGWQTRMEIIVGIAKGLEYLHEDSHVKVVHRDIKASNILLDNNFNPKIADFGLARFFADDVTHMTTRIAGTMGYLAPEYAINGQLTEKADVYSFGLVTLEIVSGRRILDQRLPQDKEQLLAWTWALYERKQQLQILDPKLDNAEVNVEEVIRVVHVALLCTQTWPGSRPPMSQVFAMLCGQSEILAIPTKPTIISMDPNQGPLQLAAETPMSSSSDIYSR